VKIHQCCDQRRRRHVPTTREQIAATTAADFLACHVHDVPLANCPSQLPRHHHTILTQLLPTSNRPPSSLVVAIFYGELTFRPNHIHTRSNHWTTTEPYSRPLPLERYSVTPWPDPFPEQCHRLTASRVWPTQRLDDCLEVVWGRLRHQPEAGIEVCGPVQRSRPL